MTDDRAEYFATVALSNSGMSDLVVSPLRYWYLHINPKRPEPRETDETRFGTALHRAVLQPDSFVSTYACEVSADDYPGCLVTMDDLKEWLRDNGLATSGKLKRELIDRVHAEDPSVPILELIEKRHAVEHAGKTILSRADWFRVGAAAHAIRSEPEIAGLLNTPFGKAEYSIYATDPETGVPLKARLDWWMPDRTLDLKTFSQKRTKTIDETVADAIYYESYYRQAYFYHYVRSIAEDNKGILRADFILGFVESEEPHETRIKALQSGANGEATLYWQKARIDVRNMIRRYADFMNRFGEKPWREPQEISPLLDHDIKALAY